MRVGVSDSAAIRVRRVVTSGDGIGFADSASVVSGDAVMKGVGVVGTGEGEVGAAHAVPATVSATIARRVQHRRRDIAFRSLHGWVALMLQL
ncbi:MAG: hypothetical protein ACRDFY_08905 [Candidatus Limnocylindria bacterium]